MSSDRFPRTIRTHSARWPFLLALTFASVLTLRAAAPTETLNFNRDVRPILSENCFHCHGPDANRREAELRLDVREAAIEALAFLPGNPEESEAIRRVLEPDPENQMPPSDSNRSLTPAQKDLLVRWVAEGAKYEPHWSYVPPVRPAVPATKLPVANPIDAFVRATLEREQLAPAPEADRRTLIRRLSLDLTGLPPAPADVEAFVASRDPEAYGKRVRQYLASPHFGERLALPWLDLVRFADTIGFHSDEPLNYWPYRDYVIAAFNRNLPFDQFTREQLAGDLLPNATPMQRVASGYNRLHRISAEGGIQDKEYLAKYAADRVRTTATVWLGSTLACAECHDHKFDPFTIKDFYRFGALFADLNEKGAYNLSGGFTRENLTEEPLFETPGQQRRATELEAEIAQLSDRLEAVCSDELAPQRAEWERAMRAELEAGTLQWTVAKPVAVVSPLGTPLTVAEENEVVAGGVNPPNDTYLVTVAAPEQPVTAMALEVLVDSSLPGDEVGRSGSGFFVSELAVTGTRADGASVPIGLTDARSSAKTKFGYPAAGAIDGDPDTAVSFARKRRGSIAVYFAEPWQGGPGSTLTLRVRHSDRHRFENLGRFRVAVHTRANPDPDPDGLPEAVLKALKTPEAKRSAKAKEELAEYHRDLLPSYSAVRAQITRATNAHEHLLVSLPSMPVSKSVPPRPMRVLPRGNWMDDSGEIVEPGVPEFMRQIVPAKGGIATRLDFAEWLVADDNPLTARTFVNRLWRIYFGEGLSRTLEDLGAQGEWPTHPDLLDWLAVEFRESGWDVKHMVELIVMSHTYRQSSEPTPAQEERDPANRLLARQSRFRLEAELVRDNALAISGLLTERIGGPSAKPYQPAGYYATLNFPKREYVPDTGEALYRRGVYTHWQRSFLHPSLMAFDAPSRDECTANRTPSNTPLQALVLLNDPTYVEAARVFAEKMLREGGRTFDARLAWAFGRALARPPTADEKALLRTFLEKQRGRYREDAAAARELVAVGEASTAADLPAPELAAWTAVARAILNLHETITRL